MNASIDASLGIDTYIFAVDYAIHQSDSTEWGVGAGLHALDLDVSFDATLNSLTIGATEQDLLAPLPNVRAYFMHAFSDKWLIGGAIGWLGASVDDYDGELLIARAYTKYRINDNWSVGLEAQMVDIDLEIIGSNSTEEYNIELPGAGLTLTYSIPR